MGFWTSLKNYAVTGISVVGRVIYNAGQTLYSVGSAVKYFNGENHPAGFAGTAVAVAGTIGSTLLGKSVPTYDRIAHPERHTLDELAPLNTGGKVVDYSLRTSGLIYGGMTSMSAYFLTIVLSKYLDSLLTNDPETALWKEVLMQIGGAAVAGANFYNYFSNDYRFIKQNTHQIAESVDQRSIACNMTMLKTMGTSALNLLTYPMQAYFFAKPAISNIPYVGEKLGPVGTNVLTGVACATTFLTVVSWLPSVYNHFSATSRDENQQEIVVPVNCKTTSYKIAAYTTGLIDSIGGSGLGPFISVVFTMNQLFGSNPYGWIIGLAALCGLNAMFMNLLFSVKQGTKSTLETLYRTDVDVRETEPLLAAEEGRFYTRDLPRGTLVFGLPPAETTAEQPHMHVHQDEEDGMAFSPYK